MTIQNPNLSRRRWLLRAGGLGCCGLGLAELLRAQSSEAAGPAGPSPVQSCIMLFYYGGPSHLDTWDLKPHAPREVRGEFNGVATSVPGLPISEHLPRCSRIVDKLAIVRSMHHGMRNHNSAAVEALCGRAPLKGDLELLTDEPNNFPNYGAAISYLKPTRDLIPSHAALPHVMYNVVQLAGQTAGFLGAAYNPLQIIRDPNDPNFRVDELVLPAELAVERLDDRRTLLRVLDSQSASMDRLSAAAPMSVYQERALNLLRSDAVRRAFDMSRESDATRERYGRNKLGQSLLLARRLVESGVRFVNVNDKIVNGQLENWDSHENNFGRLKNDLLPPADQGFSALIEDLDQRGLLDTTLVVALAEFGRTPRINKSGGRDHWPDCFSIVLAGGGVRGGMVYGSSDKLGAYPDTDPVTPADLAATLFWCFGINPTSEIRDLTHRPFRVAEGEPIRALFSRG
jgi:hypothetical protein